MNIFNVNVDDSITSGSFHSTPRPLKILFSPPCQFFVNINSIPTIQSATFRLIDFVIIHANELSGVRWCTLNFVMKCKKISLFPARTQARPYWDEVTWSLILQINRTHMWSGAPKISYLPLGYRIGNIIQSTLQFVGCKIVPTSFRFEENVRGWLQCVKKQSAVGMRISIHSLNFWDALTHGLIGCNPTTYYVACSSAETYIFTSSA